MNKLQRKLSLTLTTLVVLGLLLVSTVGALAADGPLTVYGELDITAGVYTVGTQIFVLSPTAVCSDATGLPMLCTALVDGAMVEVKGNLAGAVYTVDTVAVLGEYVGVLVSKDPLTVDAMVFTVDLNTLVPEFYTAGDTVEVVYKTVGADKLAYTVTLVASGSLSTYTYPGDIVAFDADSWEVGAHTFIVDTATILPEFYAVKDSVLVTFKMVPEGFLATEIAFVSSFPGNTYTYPGAIVSFAADSWVVGAHTFIVNAATTLPEFYAVNDSVLVTFEMTPAGFLAHDIAFVSSHPDSRYTYEGILTAFDDTTWTVGAHVFYIAELDLPIYFGPGDWMKLEFRMQGTDFYATKILYLITYVPPKTESSRCENRFKEHPVIAKIADEVSVSYDEILALFCKGFGLGEIKIAYKIAQGSAYTPEMLLSLRAQGYSWGDLKKMAAGNIPPDEVTPSNPPTDKDRERNKDKQDKVKPPDNGNGKDKEGDGDCDDNCGDGEQEDVPPGQVDNPNSNKDKDKEKNVPPGQIKDKDKNK